MNHSRLSTTLALPSRDARLPFNLLVVYEDQPTRNRALHLTHHLTRQLADDYEFRGSWWKFDHLTNDILRAQATHAAGEAHMIIVAVHARPGLDPHQAAWLEDALAARPSPGPKRALVALLAAPGSPDGSDTATSAALVDQLRRLAASADLDFFPHSFEVPSTPSLAEPGSPGRGKFAPVPDAPLPGIPGTPGTPAITGRRPGRTRVPVQRWGINE